MSIRGIDVASYQSGTPPLSGMDFVFVKATEGTSYINPKMRAQADHARRAGRVVGFYHFVRPGSMRAQAQYFVREAASIEGDPLWLDWEDGDVSCADKDDFLREVVRLRGDTHRVGLYCNTNFWLHRDTTSYCADALWIAVYNGRPGKPGIRDPWLFHQYTSTPIDTNYGAFESRAALKAWATGGNQSTSTSTMEDDLMAMSDREFYDKVWRHDGVMQSPWGTSDNPTWMPESVLEQTGKEVKAIRAELAATRAVLDKLADAVGKAGDFDVADLKREIRATVAAAVESVTATVTLDTNGEA